MFGARSLPLVLLVVLSVSVPGRAESTEAADLPPLLAVLTETGEERDGLPVLAPHPDTEQIAEQLNRGISRELTTVYRYLQIAESRASASSVEPVYILLSSKRGGFVRYGFWLNGVRKDDVPFVDVHREKRFAGYFGAMDQIFPHELAHAILHEMGIERSQAARANQLHGVGVRTDRFVAFNEGFAEHFQVMAVDHPGADPSTRALGHDVEQLAAVRRQLEKYRGELTARVSLATRMRIGFPLWFGRSEQTLRYFAVKRNEFAYQPQIPDRLLHSDPYRAYLLESLLPGDPEGERRTVARLVATEGAISSLFHRWASNEALRTAMREEGFYAAYGTDPDEITPQQNVYLKIFHVARERRPTDVLQLIDGYRELFPDEVAVLDEVVAESFSGQSVDAPPEIWLANDSFEVGTTLYDQFRSSPRIHTFDLNAASLTDLMGVPGMSLDRARALLSAAPFVSIEDVRDVNGIDADLFDRLIVMHRAMNDLADTIDPDALSFSKILAPYVWRICVVLFLAAVLGGIVHGVARNRWGAPVGRLRCAWNGAVAAIVGVFTSWIVGAPLAAIAAVTLLCGLPAALRQTWRKERAVVALVVLVAWLGASIPGVVLTLAWG